MGTRIFKSDEVDRLTERDRRRQEWYLNEMKKKRRAMLILGGMGIAAILVLVGIIMLLVHVFSPKDTAVIEDKLSKTKSSEISLVDNMADEKVSFGSGEEFQNSKVNTSERGLIVIDPGHGGYDSGCISSLKYEKEIDLEIAMLLSEKLKAKGFSVYMTRIDDSFVGINDRAILANECEGALALISIHQNSSENSSDEGVEAWTSNDATNEQLAELIALEVSEKTGAINGGVVTKDNLVICSKAEMPAVIVECGYLSNKREAQNLCEPTYQEKIATGLANAVDGFLPEKTAK